MKKRTSILGSLAAVFLAYQAYYGFYYGKEYEEKRYSPNHAFYYQKYRLFSLRALIPEMGTPGNGDGSRYSIGGYLRVFKADGTLQGESYDRCISVMEITWADDAVIGFACTDHLIPLSGTSG